MKPLFHNRSAPRRDVTCGLCSRSLRPQVAEDEFAISPPSSSPSNDMAVNSFPRRGGGRSAADRTDREYVASACTSRTRPSARTAATTASRCASRISSTAKSVGNAAAGFRRSTHLHDAAGAAPPSPAPRYSRCSSARRYSTNRTTYLDAGGAARVSLSPPLPLGEPEGRGRMRSVRSSTGRTAAYASRFSIASGGRRRRADIAAGDRRLLAVSAWGGGRETRHERRG